MLSLATVAFSLILSVYGSTEVNRARAYIYKAVPNGIPTEHIGTIDFEQSGTFVKINGSVDLPDGPHGFHIHEKGDIGNGCVAAGPHFNPHKLNHGGPDDSNRHVGDLGNINSPPSGPTMISISDSLASLSGVHSVIGRAVVIHEKVDDLGRGQSELSRTTGDAGGRIACGVIGIYEEQEVIPTTPAVPVRDTHKSSAGYSLVSMLSLLLLI